MSVEIFESILPNLGPYCFQNSAEIIIENGGKVFEDEDLHSDSVKHTEVSNEENQEN
jgi:hypothetical protein